MDVSAPLLPTLYSSRVFVELFVTYKYFPLDDNACWAKQHPPELTSATCVSVVLGELPATHPMIVPEFRQIKYR